jgi:ankyrin repeat protein
MKNILLSVVLVASSIINADSIQTIDVLNNSAQALHLTANNEDYSLSLNQIIPAFSKSIITVQVELICSPQELLFKSIINNLPEKTQEAVKAGASVNFEKDGKSPLLLAVLLKRYDIVKILLTAGAKLDDLCIQQVIKMQDIKLLSLLVRYSNSKFDVKYIIGLLSQAIIHRHQKEAIELIKELINYECDINELWDPVIRLGYYNPSDGEEMVNLLIHHGANPNHVNIRDHGITETPLLMAAAYYGNKQIVKILLDSGANIHFLVSPSGQRTPPCSLLSYAISRSPRNQKIQEVIEVLLQYGANL